MTEIVLETRNLSRHFGGVTAVDRVDFSLWENELRCLIGPNGAGKSTFFKCLTGQIEPSEGDIVIREFHAEGRQPYEIARLGVGIKTQVPNVFDGLMATFRFGTKGEPMTIEYLFSNQETNRK